MKQPRTASVFLPATLVWRAQTNAAKYPFAKVIRDQIVAAAQPWRGLSDTHLFGLFFGNTIKRSWMVWSNGYCPSCKKSVPMYTWKMNALKEPWKVRCPHCDDVFPKNDFGAFYASGLDERGIFDPKKADRKLLVNPSGPQGFGVDDGEGYVEGDKRWRFIGAYLVYGQWKQAVHGGIVALSAAYAVTGEAHYAHQAGVLLARVAELYPTHDFGKEGVMYEGPPRSGYVSTWHDACVETRELALAYDRVREALARDTALAAFLKKPSPAEVLRQIEDGILRDPQRNLDKIYSNYPQTELTLAILKTVEGWPGNRAEILALLDKTLEKATAVDGMTGEKGLTGYSVYATSGIATVLALYARIDPNFLPDLLRRNPRIGEMYRFPLETWCLGQFYPRIGDCGTFAAPSPTYCGVSFSTNPGIGASMFDFLGRLHAATGEVGFVQALHHANGKTTTDLPHDLFAESPERFQEQVSAVIAKHGTEPKLGSIDKKEWHLALLRGGEGKNARALWLDYDSGGYHHHSDGLNLGLFAQGLDLLPDFGYPPVQFGGWGAPRALWYTMAAAHNTVVVDGKDQKRVGVAITERAGYEGLPAGKTTLWRNEKTWQAVRAEGAALYGIERYERTVGMADLPGGGFYVVDFFRVTGGQDHAYFLHSGYGTVATSGLALAPGPDYGNKTQTRAFRTDPHPKSGWSVDWTLEDRFKTRPKKAPTVHLKLTCLTENASVSLCESWVAPGNYNTDTDGEWIPTVVVRRQGAAPLDTIFISVLEVYQDKPLIKKVQRRRDKLGQIEAVNVSLSNFSEDLWTLASSHLSYQREREG